ncbi:hypothetical protein D3C77_750430 [compost metagenome]
MTKPINNPEKISPNGILEIGIGPNEYKIPTANDNPPTTRTSKFVSITMIIPVLIAITSSVIIIMRTFLGFIFRLTMALCTS